MLPDVLAALILAGSLPRAACDTQPAVQSLPPDQRLSSPQNTPAELAALAALVRADKSHFPTVESVVRALKVLRVAAATLGSEADADFLIIAREGTEKHSDLALDAMGHLCDRGVHRAELVDFVRGFRTESKRAGLAMYALARDATPEEITLFDDVVVTGFREMSGDVYEDVAFYGSCARTVRNWREGVSKLGSDERFLAVAGRAVVLGGCSMESLNVVGYWSPLARWSLSELRGIYDQRALETLIKLRDTELLPAPPEWDEGSSMPAAADKRRELQLKWLDNLMPALSPLAPAEWKALRNG